MERHGSCAANVPHRFALARIVFGIFPPPLEEFSQKNNGVFFGQCVCAFFSTFPLKISLNARCGRCGFLPFGFRRVCLLRQLGNSGLHLQRLNFLAPCRVFNSTTNVLQSIHASVVPNANACAPAATVSADLSLSASAHAFAVEHTDCRNTHITRTYVSHALHAYSGPAIRLHAEHSYFADYFH